MNASAVLFGSVCAFSIALISLTSSYLYRKEPLVTSELMALVSFLPGFIISVVVFLNAPIHLRSAIVIALLIKNILYCLSFYYRYESLREFGPFVGALMLGTQPIVIFALGFILLGETLSATQGFSVALASGSLLLLANGHNKSSPQNKINWSSFAKYYAFPTFFSGLAIVWDRFFLKEQLPSSQFFVLDRIVILPAFFIALWIIGRRSFKIDIWSSTPSGVITRNWKSLCFIGLLFTVSVYTYNLALEIEKAALVGLLRNSSYPVAAFVGAFIFKQEVSLRKWVSLFLILAAAVLGAL